MDLTNLNKIAGGEYLTTKKLTELETNRHYMVTALKPVNTRFGSKIVAILDEEFQVFLPQRVSLALDKDTKLYDSLCDQANKLQLFLDYKGNGALEFSTTWKEEDKHGELKN